MEWGLWSVFGAGLLTFFSPCVLPMVPIVAANYLLSDNTSRFARLRSTLLFSLGFLLTFTLMGASLPLISEALGASKNYLLLVSGALILLYGLKMSGMILKNADNSKYFSWMSRSALLPRFDKYFPKSLHGFIFGATFGLAWTPCVGPILGGVLTYIATQDRSIAESVALMASFGFGIVAPFIALAMGGDLVQQKLNFVKKYLPKIEEATGVALVAVGIYVLTQSTFPTKESKDTVSLAFVGSDGIHRTLEEYAPGAHKLLFFHSTHCPICHAMETYLPDVEKDCNSKDFKIVRINVDEPANAVISSTYKVRAVPTLSLLSADGKELSYTVGYQSEIKLRQAINLLPKVSCSLAEKEAIKKAPAIEEGKSCSEKGNGLTC